jgi:hypothetical protein
MTIGRPKLYNDVDEMQKVIDAYFKHQDRKYAEMGQLPVYTMSGLALALGMDRRSLLDYSKDDKFLPTIQKARNKVESMVEERLMANNNATGHIFNLKNNFNWKDKSEQDLTSSDGSLTPTVVKLVPKNDK